MLVRRYDETWSPIPSLDVLAIVLGAGYMIFSSDWNASTALRTGNDRWLLFRWQCLCRQLRRRRPDRNSEIPAAGGGCLRPRSRFPTQHPVSAADLLALRPTIGRRTSHTTTEGTPLPFSALRSTQTQAQDRAMIMRAHHAMRRTNARPGLLVGCLPWTASRRLQSSRSMARLPRPHVPAPRRLRDR